MKNVVQAGSIKSLFNNVNVTVAGKTGTAQITNNEPNHALFVSFAPYENPEISITVVIPKRIFFFQCRRTCEQSISVLL